MNEKEIKNEIKKIWYKSKTIWLNLITTVSICIPDLLQNLMDNAQIIKEYKIEFYIILIILNTLFNIYIRTKTKDEIKLKK